MAHKRLISPMILFAPLILLLLFAGINLPEAYQPIAFVIFLIIVMFSLAIIKAS